MKWAQCFYSNYFNDDMHLKANGNAQSLNSKYTVWFDPGTHFYFRLKKKQSNLQRPLPHKSNKFQKLHCVLLPNKNLTLAKRHMKWARAWGFGHSSFLMISKLWFSCVNTSTTEQEKRACSDVCWNCREKSVFKCSIARNEWKVGLNTGKIREHLSQKAGLKSTDCLRYFKVSFYVSINY